MNNNYQGSRRCGANKDKCITICENDSVCAETEAKAAEAEAALADAECEACQTGRRRSTEFREPVCINTSRIYDSCRDRDCASNVRVYLTELGQSLINSAINVKLKKAEIIWVYSNVEPLSFNNGYYTVDLKFFVLTTLDVFTGPCKPHTVTGLASFDKRVILYGSEASTKVFKSNSNLGICPDLSSTWQSTEMPTVVVEAVEPVALSASIVEPDECDCCCCDCDGDGCSSATPTNAATCFPENICNIFDTPLIVDDDQRQVRVTFGIFSIIRLERDTQLLIDAVDFCIPTQECVSATEENPCNLFNDIRFPIDEFFPAGKKDDDCGCGCGCN